MRWLAITLLKMVGVLTALFFTSRLINDQLQAYYFQILIQCGIYITLAVSLNLINGITGQFSIGHAGFYAVGAYAGTAWTVLWNPILVKSLPLLKLGSPIGDALNLVIALILGMLVAALAGLLIGLPTLRLRGDYLAIVTLGFGEVIRVILLNIDAVGGARGMSGIPTLVASNGLAIFWVYLLALGAILVTRNLMNSIRGLTWLAVREDEVAADAMGVNTTQVKVTAFIIGSAFAGAAGVLYAHYFTLINPEVFNMETSIAITTMVVLGGTGSLSGVILAAVLLTSLPELLRVSLPAFKEYRMVLYALILIVLMLTRPQGLFGTREITLRGIRPRRRAAAEG